MAAECHGSRTCLDLRVTVWTVSPLLVSRTRPKHAEVSGIHTLCHLLSTGANILFFFFFFNKTAPANFPRCLTTQCDVCRPQVCCLSPLCVSLSVSDKRTWARLDPKSPLDKLYHNPAKLISQALSKQNFKMSLPGLSQKISEAGIRNSTTNLGAWRTSCRCIPCPRLEGDPQ